MKRIQASLTRTGFGLAAMGAGAIALWPVASSTFDVEKAVALATAMAIWIFSEFYMVGESSGALADHDVALASRLHAVANDNLIMFLQQHDFGNSWNKRSTDPVFDLAHELEMVTSEFEDRKLQEKNGALREAAIALANHLAFAGGPIGGGPLFSVLPEIERASGMLSDQTNAQIKKANELADGLAKKLSALYRQARSKGVNLRAEGPGLQQQR
jgi:hypothetical protein